jgi:exopolysaccharide biosynthesis polyprenyl glycosylphosphotransferase
MKPIRLFFGVLKVPLDFILTIVAHFIALKFRIIQSFDAAALPSWQNFLIFSAKSALLLVVILAINQMYELRTSRALSRELGKLFFLIFSWVMFIIAYYFIMRTFPFSRLVLMYATIITALMLALDRIIIHYTKQALFHRGIGQYRVAVVGGGHFAEDFIVKLQKHIDYKYIGYICEKPLTDDKKYLGKETELGEIISRHNLDQIIQTDNHEEKGQEILITCREHHIKYSFIPNLIDVQRTNIQISTMQGVPIIELKPTPLDGWGKIIKRIFDIVGSVIGLVAMSPLFIMSAIAIKLDSKGPIFFRKLDNGNPVLRVGQHGKLFPFYKFRTMYPHTHGQRYTTLAENNLRKNSPLVKIKNDPRITRVGKFLRRFSIDELPQLWNVFLGNMSLVGPRPHFPEEVEKYSASDKFVLEIKPGITGISQISGRSDLDFREEIRLDTYYIQNWSLDLDIKILFKTVFAVLRGYRE